jgi:SpoVK/Ycf46/Vps4 family AAA+-type ATPase
MVTPQSMSGTMSSIVGSNRPLTMQEIQEQMLKDMGALPKPPELGSWSVLSDEEEDTTTRAKTTKVKKIKKAAGKPKLSIDTVVLSQEKKDEIKAAISQLSNTELIFEEWGFGEVFEKGTAVTMLFYGTPGTGKTLMAQAIAEENNAELKIYGMAEIGSSEPGGSERTIQKIFKEAKEFFTQQRKHRVILFDECDSLLYDRSKVGVILGAQINALLSEIERHEGIVIFTTNRIATLDPALERRITAKIEFPFPDEKQRLAIWERMLPEQAPIAKNVDLKRLAKVKIPGGNIKNAVLNAVRMAAYKSGKQIEMDHFMEAVKREMAAIAAFENGRDHRVSGTAEDLGLTEGRGLTMGRKAEIKAAMKRGMTSELTNTFRKGSN